jgi:predicted Zn finger-like uncharacterized protein
LFTQCPQCQTVFRVTVAMLRAAQGRVRCGRCSHVFNALTFLIEQPASEAPPGIRPEDSAPPDISPAPNRRASDLPFDPDDYSTEDVPESALEFDLTVDDLNRVFIRAPAPSLRVRPDEPPVPVPAPSSEDTAENEIIDIEMAEAPPDEEITLEGDDIQVTASLGPRTPKIEVEAENQTSEFSAPAIAPLPLAPSRSDSLASSELLDSSDSIESPDTDERVAHEIEAAFARDPATRAEFVLPSGTRLKLNRGVAEMDFGSQPEPGHVLEQVRHHRQQTSRRWSLANGAMALLLVLQLVHFNRDALARSPMLGGAISKVYAGFGVRLSPHWDLSAYQLRQLGAAADPGESGTLRVRASVFNSADHAQPYPLLRLTLQDRYGGRVGSRDLEPREYLHVPPGQNELLGAGQRVDADIAIVDPGKDAVGFELDVCLRDAASLKCAADQPKQPG